MGRQPRGAGRAYNPSRPEAFSINLSEMIHASASVSVAKPSMGVADAVGADDFHVKAGPV